MEITSSGRTDVGRQRDHNEDFLLADPALGLYVVCDGMGGHEAGEVAAELAATTVRWSVAQTLPALAHRDGGRPPASDRVAVVLRTAIETACSRVHEMGQADVARRGMGCTCTALLVAGEIAVMGHVGDSRLYLCRGGSVMQLSEDHTFIAEAVRQGFLTAEEARLSEHRNVITRAIGKEWTVLVDTLVIDLVPGDTFLLCSDGLHQYLHDPGELAAALGAETIEAIPPHLVALANARGGSDNISALVVRAQAPAGSGTAADEGGAGSDSLRGFEALRNLELLRDLSTAEIVRFKQLCEEVAFPPGAIVVREGEVNSTLYVIAVGSAEVIRGGQRVALLPAGAHFGEMSLLNSRPRSATVRALEPCRMLAIDRDRLYGFLRQEGMLAAKFFWKLAATLSERLDDLLAHQAEVAAAAAAAAGPAAAQAPPTWPSGGYGCVRG